LADEIRLEFALRFLLSADEIEIQHTVTHVIRDTGVEESRQPIRSTPTPREADADRLEPFMVA
jgi:hypothetical protein